MGAIEDLYKAKTPGSLALQQRAELVMSAGETRAAVYHLPYSLTIERGSGSRLFDVDGNAYLDLNNNYTALVHGHAYPPIVAAAHKAIENGTTWTAKNTAQIELAEMIVERIASVEAVRFANSSSEAVLVALAVARAITGRRKILTAKWSFHGQHEAFNDGWYRGNQPPWPDTFIAEFGNASSFETILAEHGAEIAAVFLEPILGAAGLIAAEPEFFFRVQRAAKKVGAVFVLDEATVQRLATGGTQQLLGIDPDLTVLGKVIGGGFPVGGIGGKWEIMNILDPRAGALAISGTFAGNPVTLGAGIVSIRELTSDRIVVMENQILAIDVALAKAAASHGLPYSSRRAGSLLNVYLSDTPPPANQVREDGELMALFHLAALARGVFMAPRGLMCSSTVLSDAEVDEAIDRLETALADVAAEC